MYVNSLCINNNVYYNFWKTRIKKICTLIELSDPNESSDRLEIARKKVPTKIQVARNKIQVLTNCELSLLLGLKWDILTVQVSVSDGRFPLYWLSFVQTFSMTYVTFIVFCAMVFLHGVSLILIRLLKAIPRHTFILAISSTDFTSTFSLQ